MRERDMKMEEKGSLLLGILAGLVGVVLGGVAYFIMTKLGRIAFITSIAGVYLSFTFYVKVRKTDRLGLPIAIFFMFCNLFMIFTVDAIIFGQAVVAKFPGVGFSEAFYAYPRVLKEEGLIIYDYLNIAIVVIGSLATAFATTGDYNTDNQAAVNSRNEVMEDDYTMDEEDSEEM